MTEVRIDFNAAWRRDARCKDTGDTAMFLGATPQTEAAAKRLCAECVVGIDCNKFAEAIGKNARQGYIYAGLTEQERQAL
jgi:hypothetical protein